jgi:signal transduction histidine kinase
MNVSSLLLIGLNHEARTAATTAARHVFPTAIVSDLPSLDAARKFAPSAAGAELLLLGDPDRTSLAQAIATVDRSALPRWTIVVFGKCPTPVAEVAAIVKPENWNASWLAQVLLSAAREHALRHENARLHGDLSTIGRRISHDLRTPLTAIYTACEAINEIADGDSDHAVFTQSISTSTNELAQLIERVSSLVKASADPVTMENVAMGEVVFNTLQRLESSILRKGALVTQPPTWPRLTGVASWLEIVWFNLIANALQHTPSAPRIELGWSEAAGQFRFWVNDHGPGVPAGKIEKLFQPFHELHRLNAPRGLGLSVVQRLVELQGGVCGYEPRPTGGAHFFFTLPAAQTP